MGELDALRVREEVLQAMYWMRSEGLADEPAAAELARFLAVGADRPTHGECDEDCWCHESPEEAARCLEERQHVH